MMEAGHFNRGANGHTNGQPVNNTGLPDHQFRELLEVVHNASTSRQEWFRSLFDSRRNIEDECQLPSYGSGIPAEYYKQLYDRFGIGNKVVTIMPKECFQRSPRVWEDDGNKRNTPFELAWDALGSQVNTGGGPSWHLDETGSPIWEHMQRADSLSRIGKFGIILLGFSDGKDLAAPMDGVLKTPDWVADDLELDSLEGKGVDKDGKERKGLSELTDREKDVLHNLRREGALIRNAVSKMSQGVEPTDRAKRLDGSDFLDTQGSFGGSYGRPGGQGGQLPNAPWGGYGPQAHLGTDAQYYGVQFGPTEELSLKPAKKGVRLMFMRPYDESLVQIVRYEWNILSPRFGMPIMYRVTLNDPRTQSSGIGLPLSTVFVHWSRVIHLADVHHTPCSSEIFAYPAMQPVLDNLLGLRKLYSAGPEAFWKTCLPVWSLETHPQLGGDVRVNTGELKDTLEQVFEGLQRYLITTGMEVKMVAGTPGDPSQQIAVQLEAICIQIGIPMRVFKGSERGELASSQDDSKWNDVIRNRQNLYLTPRVIIPLIDRLIMVGVLPEPGKGAGQQAVTNARRRGQWVIEKPDGFLILNAVDPRLKKRVAPVPTTEDEDATAETAAGETGAEAQRVPQGASGAEAGAQDLADTQDMQGVTDDSQTGVDGTGEVATEESGADGSDGAVQGAEAGQDEGQALADGLSSGPTTVGSDGQPQTPFVDAGASPAGPVPAAALRGAKFVSKAGYTIEWPDLESLGDAEKATIAGAKMTALQTYVGQGAAPSTKMTDLDFWTRIMGMEEEEAREIIDAAILQQQMDKAEAQAQADAAGHVPSPPPGFEKPEPDADKGQPANKIGAGESAVDPETGKITAVSPHAPPQPGATHIFPGGGGPAPAAPGAEQPSPATGPTPFQPHPSSDAAGQELQPQSAAGEQQPGTPFVGNTYVEDDDWTANSNPEGHNQYTGGSGKEVHEEEPWDVDCFTSGGEEGGECKPHPELAHLFTKYADRIAKAGGLGRVIDAMIAGARGKLHRDIIRDLTEHAKGPGTDAIRKREQARNPDAEVWWESPSEGALFGTTKVHRPRTANARPLITNSLTEAGCPFGVLPDGQLLSPLLQKALSGDVLFTPVLQEALDYISNADEQHRDWHGRWAKEGGGKGADFAKWIKGTAVVDESGNPKMVHRSSYSGKHDVPIFMTTDESAAAEFHQDLASGEDLEGDAGRAASVHSGYAAIKNPLELTEQGQAKLMEIVRKARVEVEGTPGWDDFHCDEIAEHSPYDGDNVQDLVYIPKVRKALQAAGYDGLKLLDQFGGEHLAETYVAFSSSQVRLLPPAKDVRNWSIVELDLPNNYFSNEGRDVYRVSGGINGRVASLLINSESGFTRVYVPVAVLNAPGYGATAGPINPEFEAKHQRDKGRFAAGQGAGAGEQGNEVAQPVHIGPSKATAAAGAHGTEEHDQVGEHGAGEHGAHGHGAGHELEHTAHQAHVAHEAHEVAEVLGGGHSEAASAVKGHFAEAAEHGVGEHLEHEAGAGLGEHGGHEHTLADAGAIIASHVYGPALKAVSAILGKIPGAKRVGAAISAVHEGASKLAEKAVAGMKSRYGDATTSAILGAGSLTQGATVGALTGGTVAKAMPAKGLIGAIPLLAVAEVGKRLGLVGQGSKLEAGLSRAGSWIHAIKSVVGKGVGAVAGVADKALMGAAKGAGKATGAVIRGAKKLTGNELYDQWLVENGWREFDEDGILVNAGPVSMTPEQMQQAFQQMMGEMNGGFESLLEQHKGDLLSGQGAQALQQMGDAEEGDDGQDEDAAADGQGDEKAGEAGEGNPGEDGQADDGWDTPPDQAGDEGGDQPSPDDGSNGGGPTPPINPRQGIEAAGGAAKAAPNPAPIQPPPQPMTPSAPVVPPAPAPVPAQPPQRPMSVPSVAPAAPPGGAAPGVGGPPPPPPQEGGAPKPGKPFPPVGNAKSFEQRVIEATKMLNSHEGRMPGYGSVWIRGRDVWYVGGDGDSREFGKLVEPIFKAAGAKSVRYETESDPKENGWKYLGTSDVQNAGALKDIKHKLLDFSEEALDGLMVYANEDKKQAVVDRLDWYDKSDDEDPASDAVRWLKEAGYKVLEQNEGPSFKGNGWVTLNEFDEAKVHRSEDGRFGSGGSSTAEEAASRSVDETLKSPEFKQWFGDWEKPPKRKGLLSRVIDWATGKPKQTYSVEPSEVEDVEGKPIIVYHGTKAQFDEFDKNKQNPKSLFGPGFYFTESEKVASGYKEGNVFSETAGKEEGSGHVLSVFLNIKKPFNADKHLANLVKNPGIARFSYNFISDALGGNKEATARLKALGFDGITHVGDDGGGGKHRVWIAFEPNQIKATDAKSFDPKSANIHNANPKGHNQYTGQTGPAAVSAFGRLKARAVAVFDKLPDFIKAPAKALLKVWYAGYVAGHKMVAAVCRAKGMSEEQAEKTAAVVSAADALLGGNKTAILHPAMPLVPLGSLAYLAVSTAKHPLATLRAAKGAVKAAAERFKRMVKEEGMATIRNAEEGWDDE